MIDSVHACLLKEARNGSKKKRGQHRAQRLQICAVKAVRPRMVEEWFHNGHLRHSTGVSCLDRVVVLQLGQFDSLHPPPHPYSFTQEKNASRWSKCRALNGIGKRRFESPILRSAVQGINLRSFSPAHINLVASVTSKCQDVKPSIFIRRVINFEGEREEGKNSAACLNHI